MRWIRLSESGIPDRLLSELPLKCAYCGSDMYVGFNDFGRCTSLKCADDNCVAMIGARIVFIAELLNIEQLGKATALSYARNNKYKYPIEVLGTLGIKPKVSLGTYLRLNCIPGIDQKWETMAEEKNCYTLEEMLNAYPDCAELKDNISMLYENLKFVELKQREFAKEPAAVLTIMITGTPIGYPTKEAFVDACNKACCGYIRIIHQKTVRQSGVHCLIREPGSTTRTKVEAAKKAGIPILTSEQFVQCLYNTLMGGKDDTSRVCKQVL